jgi:hypothetical protein
LTAEIFREQYNKNCKDSCLRKKSVAAAAGKEDIYTDGAKVFIVKMDIP